MTAHERIHPEVLKSQRRRRVAAGSGTTLADVNKLLRGFEQMQSVMKSVAARQQGCAGRPHAAPASGMDPSQLGLPRP